MAKPGTLPTWATDGGTTLEPSAGEKAAGFSASQKPPARWFNWWMNNVYQWTSYLNGLPTDNDFRNANFTWGGNHDFSNAITVPAGAGNDAGVDNASTSRTILIPLTSFMPEISGSGVPEWYLEPSGGGADQPRWTARTVNTHLFCCLDGFLHSGMQISAIDILLEPAAARATAGNRMQIGLYTTDINFTTPSIGATMTANVTATDDGNATFQKVSPAFGGSSYTLTRSAQHKLLRIRSGASTVGDHVYAARLTVAQSTLSTW